MVNKFYKLIKNAIIFFNYAGLGPISQNAQKCVNEQKIYFMAYVFYVLWVEGQFWLFSKIKQN